MIFEVIKEIKIKTKYSWLNSYLQPTILKTKKHIQIFFGARDKLGKSRPAYIEIDSLKSSNILRYSKKPLMDLGPKGSFDEDGIVPTFVTNDKKKTFMFYAGYQKSKTAKFLAFTGLAIKKKNFFYRNSYSPFLDRLDSNFLFNVIHHVQKYKKKKYFFYGFGNKIIKNTPSYEIGVYVKNFSKKNTKKIIKLNQNKKEIRIGRPNIIKIKDFFHLFFCVSTSTSKFHIEYAISKNLKDWTRKGKVKFVSDFKLKNKFSKMQAYPNVIKENDKIYMIFNGNNFGKSGILISRMLDQNK